MYNFTLTIKTGSMLWVAANKCFKCGKYVLVDYIKRAKNIIQYSAY